MTREFCDRCDREIANGAPRSNIRGVHETRGDTPSVESDIFAAICEDCYRSWLRFMREMVRAGV